MKRIFTLFNGVLITATLSAQAPRNSLLEISESVFTLDNARTICIKENLRNTFGDDLAILSYHPDDFQGPGFTADPFFNQAAEQWWNIYGTPGFGQGYVDRVSYNGNNLVLGRSFWSDTIAARINRTAIAEVTLPEVLFDAAKRQIFARVQVVFEKENLELKDFRFFLLVAANNQLGIQRFDTLDLTLCTAFIDPADTNYFLTDTLDSFMHNDVVIANPSGFAGVDNIIPSEVAQGARYTTSFTYTVPTKYNIEDLKVVGFVADYNGNNLAANAVVNVAQSADFVLYDSDDETDPNHPNNPDNPKSVFNQANWPTGLNESLPVDINLLVYPNPLIDLGLAAFNVPSRQRVNVYLTDLEGRMTKVVYNQVLTQGRHKAAVSTSNLASGFYILHVEGENFKQQTRIVIQ